MKKLIKVLAVVFMGLSLTGGCLWVINTVQAAKNGSPALLPAAQDDIPRKPVLVDDFKDGNWVNNLGGKVECWAINGGAVTCTMKVAGNEGFLQMQYDVRPANSYAVAASELLSMDMTLLDTIWVAIKGATGGEPIYVEPRDCRGQSPKEKIGDHLAQGIGTSDYRAVAIPRAEYSNVITDWHCIDRLNIIPSSEIGSGQGTIYIDDIRLLPAKVVVDDFHDVIAENELGGEANYWESDPGNITVGYEREQLKLDYDVRETDPLAEAAYYTKFRSTNLLQYKDTLFFTVRGQQGEEKIAVEFMDCGLGGTVNIPKIKVSDYLVGGITTEDQVVAIPLAAFARGMDWRCTDQLNILFSAQPWLQSGQGRVFIDDIIVAPKPPLVPLIIDRFDDCDLWNAQVLEWVKNTSGQASIDLDIDPSYRYGNNGCGLRITYNVQGNSAAWLYSDLAGIDVRDYTYLRFLLKGAAGNEEPHIYLRDKNNPPRYYSDIVVTQEWQEILIPLDYFKPAANLANLSELTIAFEWKTMSGTVYLDDLAFVRPEVYLPIVFKQSQTFCPDPPPSCASPYNNYEPNDFRCSTAAALSSGVPIQSYICAPDDIDDYYLITVNQLGPISAQLTNLPKGVDYDLYLYYQDKIVAKSRNYGNTNESLGYTPTEPGTYYLRVYPYSGYRLSPYTLQANFQ